MPLGLISAILLAPLILVTLCFAIELLVGLPRGRRLQFATSPARAVIVVPAHNEEAIIGPNLAALKAAAGDAARILVVADNCDDATAKIVRDLGIDVAERSDAVLRGKGFALAFARDLLRQNPPDVVLVIDADCRTDPESIARLIVSCAASGRPCQATNLQTPSPSASPAVQLSTFAFYVKNVIRQRALQRLAGRAHLFGTGMAFPWAIFESASLATHNIVEDLQMGVELAEAGKAPIAVEEASVWSDPEAETNMLVQRQRWEGGFLQNAVIAAPSLFGRSLRNNDLRGLWGAINLLIPPVALLVLLDVAALALGAFLWIAGASVWPIAALAASLLLAGLGLALAWATGGRRFVSIGSLVRIPFYVLRKIPMYLGFARRGTPQDWIRTR